MDRGAWRATIHGGQAPIHGVTGVRHDLATQPPPPRAGQDIQARLYWGSGGYRREQTQQLHWLTPRGGDELVAYVG